MPVLNPQLDFTISESINLISEDGTTLKSNKPLEIENGGNFMIQVDNISAELENGYTLKSNGSDLSSKEISLSIGDDDLIDGYQGKNKINNYYGGWLGEIALDITGEIAASAEELSQENIGNLAVTIAPVVEEFVVTRDNWDNMLDDINNPIDDFTIPNSFTVTSGPKNPLYIVTKIDTNAFSSSNVENVTIESGIELGDGAFADCSTLQSVKIESGVNSTGIGAFSGCAALTTIEMPESFNTISDYMLFGCKSLTKIAIPDNITSIGKGAFSQCDNLTDITIGNGVKIMGEHAFYVENQTDTLLTTENQVALDYNWAGDNRVFPQPIEITSTNYQDICTITDKVLTIPETYTDDDGNQFIVTSIAAKAFYYNMTFNYVEFPDTLEKMGDMAFCGSALKEVTIPHNVKLGTYIFASCMALNKATFEEGCTSSSIGTFSSCRFLHEVQLPETMLNIEQKALYDCLQLWEINIPDSVTNIDATAFNCSVPTGHELMVTTNNPLALEYKWTDRDVSFY